MSDEHANNHPLNNPGTGQHPLSDRPPEKQKPGPEGIAIPIPLEAQQPVLTYALIVINVGIFALRYFVPDLSNALLVGGYTDTQAVLRDGEYYRLLTSMFLHLNEAHMLFNGIALYYIGSNLERLFGSVRFGLIYLLGGLAGSILPLFVSEGGLGASGAVFAIWGAEIIFLYQNRQIFGKAGRARIQNTVMLMLFNFIFGFSANALATVADSGVRVGNAAHFGGLIGGVILAWLIAPRLVARRKEIVREGEIPIEIVRTNSLRDKLPAILYFCIGLIALLLIAMLLRS